PLFLYVASLLLILRPPRPPLFPYTTLFRSVGAHITAASSGGPRYDSSLSAEQRRSGDNGIWLCQNCGKLVDNDEARYSVAALREDRKSTRLNSSHQIISYAVFCLKKKTIHN